MFSLEFRNVHTEVNTFFVTKINAYLCHRWTVTVEFSKIRCFLSPFVDLTSDGSHIPL